ncbi:MAG: 30S ribosomal protein S12 methylthiotransferase RimO [Coriobacteriia bacterium]|nr:30S ribosomal protein S12 methylthiotransferase RimO [Coriobacteriia bacterium]
MISVAFVTLGCPKNEVDSAAMRALVAGSRYELCADTRDADVIVVNTCSFIATAAEASVETILDLAQDRGDLPTARKNKGDRRFPSPLILVTGCLVNRYGEGELEAELPEVSAFVPIEGESDLLRVIEALTGEPAGAPEAGNEHPAASAFGQAGAPSAYLMIADGCDRTCSYCTIPAIRGPYRSRTPDELLAEARQLVAGGARELVLIAQDTTAYGHDLPDRPTLAALVAQLCEETDLAWLRLMYLQPEGVTDELIEAIATHPQVVRSLEMPLQHCASRLLRAMQRAGGRAQFTALIARLRARLPDLALRTTLITGFPGEREEDFAELLDFVRETGFDYVGVFPFSPEDETAAAALEDQVDEETRLARAQTLRDAADEIGWERAAAHVGQTIEVLVEGFDPEEGRWQGRAPFQAPDIDGVVWIDPGAPGALKPQPGAIMKVTIQDTLLYDLEGVTRHEKETA